MSDEDSSQQHSGDCQTQAVQLAPSHLTAGLVRGYNDYSQHALGSHSHLELPHPEAVLIFNLGEAITITDAAGSVLHIAAGQGFAAGPHLSPALSAFCNSQQGMHVDLPLEALHRLLNLPMTELRDRVVRLDDALSPAALRPLEGLTGLPGAAARARAVDDWIAGIIAKCAVDQAIDPRLQASLTLLRRTSLDINEIARNVGWSRRTLTTHVTTALGVGPRSFRRLLRFGRLSARIDAGERGWASLAAACGYSDQPHMIREFRELAGMTPGQFVAADAQGAATLA